MKTTYTVEELFEDIPGDTENVIMKLPPEICEAQGWVEGDTINIEVKVGAMVLSKVNDITTIVRAGQ
jgi:hypothetical protein